MRIPSGASAGACAGLDLLHVAGASTSSALAGQKLRVPAPSAFLAAASVTQSDSARLTEVILEGRNDLLGGQSSKSRDGGFFIDELREFDVLCGRGGRSNHVSNA